MNKMSNEVLIIGVMWISLSVMSFSIGLAIFPVVAIALLVTGVTLRNYQECECDYDDDEVEYEDNDAEYDVDEELIELFQSPLSADINDLDATERLIINGDFQFSPGIMEVLRTQFNVSTDREAIERALVLAHIVLGHGNSIRIRGVDEPHEDTEILHLDK
jgi:hypothetical protein